MVTDDMPVSCGNLKHVVQNLLGGAIADSIYPVGAIYLSTSATDPATLFGGTWQRIQDRFLLCAGSTYSAGSTGGEAKHTLTVNEMPAHTHGLSFGIGYNDIGGLDPTNGGSGMSTLSSGGGAAHNNMPPYLAVYAWRRTA